MDNETAKKLRARALGTARSKGFFRDAEDFAQEVLSRYCAGKGKGQTIDQAVIDAIRSEYGHPRNGNYETRKAFSNPSVLLPSDVDPRNSISEWESQNDTLKILDQLEGNQRIVMCLIYYWGFDFQEVADCLGVSQSQISYYHKKAAATLKSKLTKRKSKMIQSTGQSKKT